MLWGYASDTVIGLGRPRRKDTVCFEDFWKSQSGHGVGYSHISFHKDDAVYAVLESLFLCQIFWYVHVALSDITSIFGTELG